MENTAPTSSPERFSPKSFVLRRNYDYSGNEVDPSLSMIVREATRQDKISFILRLKEKGYASNLDKKALREYFKNVLYLAMEKEEVVILAREAIIHEVTNEEELEALKQAEEDKKKKAAEKTQP